MAANQGFHCYGSTSVENSMCGYRDVPKNKFIFVNQNNQNLVKRSTILVNPRFKDNSKVFINPNFSANALKDTLVNRPHIYVNPKLINSISNSHIQSDLSVNRNPLEVIPTDTSGKMLLSTKNKLIKVPVLKSNNMSQKLTYVPKSVGTGQIKKVSSTDRVLISTKNKLIKVSESNTNYPTSSSFQKTTNSSSNLYKKVNISPHKILKTPEHCKVLRTKIMSSRNKKLILKHSINTRFRYIKTGLTKRIDNTAIHSKHKIVNKVPDLNKIVSQSVHHVGRNSPNCRKRFIFVNKYNSSSFLANNVILKNTSQKSLVNINGILYQNSPSALKKTNLSVRQHKDNLFTPLNNNVRRSASKLSPKFKRLSGHTIKGYGGRYKLVKPRIATASKLKKSNVPCPMFKKHGKCNGQKNGTCIKIHNSDQIVLCPKFLQGACIKKNCLLSHKVSHEKMPTCKFFLEGLCSRDDCQYLHVKISPKADICRNFLEGFCKEGTKCEKRHQLLCPEYEKFQKCSRSKCEYPHIPKASFDKTVTKKITKVIKKKKKEIVKEETSEKPTIRYYIEIENKKDIEETLISKRPKLGSLPSYIPFSEASPVS